MSPVATVGQVYRCRVCGSEVTLIRAGGAEPTPFCCNQPMVRDEVEPVYYCAICGAEVTVIRDGHGELTPYCCNQLMQRKN